MAKSADAYGQGTKWFAALAGAAGAELVSWLAAGASGSTPDDERLVQLFEECVDEAERFAHGEVRRREDRYGEVPDIGADPEGAASEALIGALGTWDRERDGDVRTFVLRSISAAIGAEAERAKAGRGEPRIRRRGDRALAEVQLKRVLAYDNPAYYEPGDEMCADENCLDDRCAYHNPAYREHPTADDFRFAARLYNDELATRYLEEQATKAGCVEPDYPVEAARRELRRRGDLLTARQFERLVSRSPVAPRVSSIEVERDAAAAADREDADTAQNDIAEPTSSYEQGYERGDEWEDSSLFPALLRLEEEDDIGATIIKLRTRDQLSWQKIAEEVSRSQTNVRHRYERALERVNWLIWKERHGVGSSDND